MKVSLTGIKPTGIPHLGNYLGAIKPALELAKQYQARYFIADYHALNTILCGKSLQEYTYSVAAVWLASGLDSKKSLIYRQSDIPEIFELSTFLMNFTAKGLMNRSHAYKSVVDKNLAKNKAGDFRINMGLFTYPVLMAADILLFDTNIVPVGKDQIQHVEYAIDIAQRVNHTYGEQLLVIPEIKSSSNVQLITGTDGRKMSKSYNNTLELYLPSKKMRKQVMKIVTNSQKIEEVKSTENCNVFSLYKLFANVEEQKTLALRYKQGGMGWGDAKQTLFEKLEEVLGEQRDYYFELLADKEKIDSILKEGAQQAKQIATKTMKRIRKIAGFR